MLNFWDYNVWGFLNLLAVLLGSILLANVLKRHIPFLQASLVPTSVLGGGVLLAIVGIWRVITGEDFFETPFFGGNGTATLESRNNTPQNNRLTHGKLTHNRLTRNRLGSGSLNRNNLNHHRHRYVTAFRFHSGGSRRSCWVRVNSRSAQCCSVQSQMLANQCLRVDMLKQTSNCAVGNSCFHNLYTLK